MKKNKLKLKNISYPMFKAASLVGFFFFLAGAITIFLLTDDFALLIGYIGVTVAYFAMFITVSLSEMTTNELKKKLNKIIKMLEKEKS